MISDLKIIFMGTPEFSAIVLEKMIDAGYVPTMVITAPDKPVGRKQVLTPSSVKLLAEKNKIPVLQPEDILDSKFYILNSKPDLIVLAAFGQIIPKEILKIPQNGCLNVHPSLLPKYRGASPIQAAILNNDTETGITIMLMDELLDHGPVITKDKLLITNNETTETLTKKLAKLGAKLLIETLPKWINGEIKAMPQDDLKTTFTKIIKKEDGQINWHKSAEEIERMVRAYNTWPGAYTRIKCQNSNDKCQSNDKILKILKASVLKNENNPELRRVQGYPASHVVHVKKEPGTVFLTPNRKLAVACGPARHASLQGVAGRQNALILEEIQLEGKKIMTAHNFLNGYPWIIGSILK